MAQVINTEQHFITEEERSKIIYVLPTDNDESSRLLKQHLALKYAQQRNFHAPLLTKLNKGIHVLDSGSGPGCWSLEMAKEFPKSTFQAVDMAPYDLVVSQDKLPGNFKFTVGNLLEGLPFEDNTFDYVYQRLLFLGLNNEGWVKVLSELFRVLKPGGYIELLEPDIEDFVNIGPTMKLFQSTLASALKSKGICTSAGVDLEDRLKNTGFVNQVQTKMYFNMNHTDLSGELLWDDFRTAAFRIQPLFAYKEPRLADPTTFEQELQECERQAKEGKAQAIWYSYYAQKPE